MNERIEASRRRVLAGVATLAGTSALAGCSGLWNQTGATDVAAYNVGSVAETVAVTITGTGDEEPHTSRTLSLAAGEHVDAVNRSKLPTNMGYTVEVAVEGGPTETFEWADPKVELAPLYVLVDESENIDFLLKAG